MIALLIVINVISNSFQTFQNFLPEGGRQQNVSRAPRSRKDPRLMNGKEYPTHSYNAPPTVGPRIKPRPKHVSNKA